MITHLHSIEIFNNFAFGMEWIGMEWMTKVFII